MVINYSLTARRRRQQLGLSQREVAERTGCHKRTVRAFEHNEHQIGFDYVLAIYKALGLKLVVEAEKG